MRQKRSVYQSCAACSIRNRVKRGSSRSSRIAATVRALPMFRLRVFILLIAVLASDAASALEVKEKRWGFDGRVRAGRFNILSVLVANPDARDFDGQFVLEDHRGLEKSVGAPVVQPVYLSAGTRRWVQFHVFINQPGADWMLRWGKGARDSEKIDGAQAGAPARVLLTDPEGVFTTPSGMRAFPDDLFPTTVAATDALDAVVLDHAPRWETARREAFLDWLRVGGTVHLLHGPDGQFPQFPEPLAVLNTNAERTRFGAGVIARHNAVRAEVNDQFLATQGFPVSELRTNAKVLIYSFESQLLQKLAALTKPEIAWWMIYVLTAGYVIVVGPAHYRWSKRLPWLRSISLLVAIVVGFGGAFAFAGRRGASEKQQIRALAIAHSLGDGRYDVSQWISAFANRGALYKLSHAGPANLYATAMDLDSVNGAIVNGRDGHFEVDIPIFSTRPFVHRGVLAGDRTEVSVASWQTDEPGHLTDLTLVPVAGFPKKVARAWVHHRGVFYELKLAGDRWVLNGTGKITTDFFPDSYFSGMNLESYGGMGRFGGDEGQARDEKWLANSGPLLIARALGTIEGLPNVITRPPLPADQLQLYIHADLPDSFRVQDPRFGNQEGHVLYVQDVFKP